LPVAGVGNRRAPFQRRLNLLSLRGAKRDELKTDLRSHCTNNFRRDRLLVGVRQWDFERNHLAQRQSLGNERAKTAFAEITCPALQAKFLAVSLQMKMNSNLGLEHVPRQDGVWRSGRAV